MSGNEVYVCNHSGAVTRGRLAGLSEFIVLPIFCILGPPFGAVAAFLPMNLWKYYTTGRLPFYQIDGWIIVFIIFSSYVFGFIQAFLVGLYAVFDLWRNRHMRFFHLIFVCILISVIYTVYKKYDSSYKIYNLLNIDEIKNLFFAVYINVTATIGCWILLCWVRLPPIEAKQLS